jgi:hypothetical protein
MNIVTSAATLLFDADAYRRMADELATVTAERDAALQEVAALTEQLRAMTLDKAFYFDMAVANDAWQKARRHHALP